MNRNRRSSIVAVSVAVCLAVFTCATALRAGDGSRPAVKPDAESMPAAVMDGLKAKFPKAEIEKWTREEEDGVTLYDIEFRQEGQKFEADILADGRIDNWEQAMAKSELPAPVVKAVEATYPGAAMNEVMRITTVTKGKEALQGYEIALTTAEKKNAELTVAPDGKILEDSGTEVKEKKSKQ